MENNTFTAENIFYSAQSKALIKLDDSSTEFVDPILSVDPSSGPWAMWGTSNNNAFIWAEKMRKCGVLTAAITGKARIAIGRGIRPVIITGVDADGTE